MRKSLHASRKETAIYRTAEDRILEAIIAVVMVITLILTIYPFYYILVISFNDGSDAMRGGIYFFPRVFTLDNYSKFLNDTKWISAIGISVSRTLIGTIVTVFFTCLVAYAMSFRDLALRKTYYGLMLFCMYFSGGLIPFYLTLREYGLLNTFWVYVIPGMFSIYYMILAVSFFQSMPKPLIESAYLDGASDMTIYLRIILPLSKPLLAALALYAAVWQWNNWTDTAYYTIANPSLRTLSYLLRDVILANETGVRGVTSSSESGVLLTVTSKSIQMAAMVVATLPIMCVYPFLQKYFIKGIMLGAVKG